MDVLPKQHHATKEVDPKGTATTRGRRLPTRTLYFSSDKGPRVSTHHIGEGDQGFLFLWTSCHTLIRSIGRVLPAIFRKPTMIGPARLASRRSAVAQRGARASSRMNATMRRSLPQTLRRATALRCYTTEKVLELRTGISAKADQPLTVYDPQNEKENCGVGLIASLKSDPRRKIVTQADEMLVRMAHRGGCGCDPASGDGSGT